MGGSSAPSETPASRSRRVPCTLLLSLVLGRWYAVKAASEEIVPKIRTQWRMSEGFGALIRGSGQGTRAASGDTRGHGRASGGRSGRRVLEDGSAPPSTPTRRRTAVGEFATSWPRTVCRPMNSRSRGSCVRDGWRPADAYESAGAAPTRARYLGTPVTERGMTSAPGYPTSCGSPTSRSSASPRGRSISVPCLVASTGR